MRLRRALPALVCAALLPALVGCAGDSGDDPGEGESSVSLDSSSPPASPSEASSSAAPDRAALPTAFPDVGLTFALPPELAPQLRDAVAAYLDFEHLHLRIVRTARFDAAITRQATDTALGSIRDTVAYLRKNDGRFGGELTIEVEVADSRLDGEPRLVYLDACQDSSRLTLTQGGEPTALEGRQRVPYRVGLQLVGGQWKVTEYGSTEGSC